MFRRAFASLAVLALAAFAAPSLAQVAALQPPPADFAGVSAEITMLAAVLGAPARGAAVVARMESGLADIRASRADAPPTPFELRMRAKGIL